MTDEAMFSPAQGSKQYVTVVGAVAIVIGILLAFFIARGITTVLRRISGQMDEAAEQVAAASGQVSSATQQLAEGASEQAAANAEESASASEEMNAQAEQMKRFVEKLVALAGGSANGRADRKRVLVGNPTRGISKAIALKASETRGREIDIAQAQEARPEKIIPMDDADCKDF